nr:NADH dehydrogenase subunit 4 [Exechonella vieirai]
MIMMVWMAVMMTMKNKKNLNNTLLFLLTTIPIMSMMMKKNMTFFTFTSKFTHISNLNITMMMLTVWISSLMITATNKPSLMNNSPKLFYLTIMMLMFISIMFFSTNNLLTLYVTFETSLFPTLLLILKWGYQPERLQASFYFMMYTITASIPLLFMIMKMKNCLSTATLYSLAPMISVNSNFNYTLMQISLLMAFLVKLPTWGLHLWLPKAHVEAPISGSMILAGILLKLGGYGLMVITKMTYKIKTKMYPMIYSVNLWGALIVSFICMTMTDMKKMIAYSSVIHMNMMVLSILNHSSIGLLGSYLMMISHGLSSPLMFTMASLNYEKNKSRNLLLQQGMAPLQPSLNLMWFLSLAANMAAPPSLNLMSEMMVYMTMMKTSSWMMINIITMTILSAAYNLYLYSSQQGNKTKNQYPHTHTNSSMLMTTTMLITPCFLTFTIITKMT